jgi:Xaa-Pro dipeptidase
MVRKTVGSGKVATDLPMDGLPSVDLSLLRSPLTDAEVSRFRWLAQQTAEVTAVALRELEPGITEEEMSGLVSQKLLSRGILPTVLLMATDDRIRKYKHAVDRGGVLQRF